MFGYICFAVILVHYVQCAGQCPATPCLCLTNTGIILCNDKRLRTVPAFPVDVKSVSNIIRMQNNFLTNISLIQSEWPVLSEVDLTGNVNLACGSVEEIRKWTMVIAPQCMVSTSPATVGTTQRSSAWTTTAGTTQARTTTVKTTQARTTTVKTTQASSARTTRSTPAVTREVTSKGSQTPTLPQLPTSLYNNTSGVPPVSTTRTLIIVTVLLTITVLILIAICAICVFKYYTHRRVRYCCIPVTVPVIDLELQEHKYTVGNEFVTEL